MSNAQLTEIRRRIVIVILSLSADDVTACMHLDAGERVFEITAFQYVGRNSGQSQWPK